MKGIDTNVLVRYLVRDDEKQAEKASAIIKKADDTFFINKVVLCELVWVLESAYGYSKTEIGTVLDKLLIIRQFEIEAKDTMRQAINDYKTGKGDLADYLIGGINLINGCTSTHTFDRSLKNSPLFSVL